MAASSSSIVFAYLVLSRALAAQTPPYCGLAVRITDPQGIPLVAEVSVDDDHSRQLKKSGENGLAEFCGLGIKPVEVTIGRGGCDEIAIRKVELYWGRTRPLSVTYTPCWLSGQPPPTTACSIMLRVVDNRGAPVQGVTVETQFGPTSDTSDAYGRLRTGIGFDETLDIRVSAAGFRSKGRSIHCSRSEPIIEERVEIEKQGQRPVPPNAK